MHKEMAHVLLLALAAALAGCAPTTSITDARTSYFATVDGSDDDCEGWLDWCVEAGYPQADCEERPMQYQYQDDDIFYFMDMESFETIGIGEEFLGGAEKYLLDALEVQVMVYNGRPVGIELPNFIEAEITHCEPGVKGNTAQGATKPATISCGATVQVPLFVERGEIIKVDTRDGGKYVSRVRN